MVQQSDLELVNVVVGQQAVQVEQVEQQVELKVCFDLEELENPWDEQRSLQEVDEQ